MRNKSYSLYPNFQKGVCLWTDFLCIAHIPSIIGMIMFSALSVSSGQGNLTPTMFV